MELPVGLLRGEETAGNHVAEWIKSDCPSPIILGISGVSIFFDVVFLGLGKGNVT